MGMFPGGREVGGSAAGGVVQAELGWRRADTDDSMGQACSSGRGSAPPRGPWAGGGAGHTDSGGSQGFSASSACCPR